MDELSCRHLGHAPISFNELTGTGRARSPSTGSRSIVTAYAAEDADVTLRLWQVLEAAARRRTPGDGLRDPGAAHGRRAGLHGGTRHPGRPTNPLRLSGDFAQVLARLEDEIQEIAGETFARLPKQIGDILFGKMGQGRAEDADGPVGDARDAPRRACPGRPRTAEEDPGMAPAREAEIHLYRHCFRSTSTRRRSGCTPPTRSRRRPRAASPSDPNLQNIPVRTEAAARSAPPSSRRRDTRSSADYSQIELRLLAHIADILQLKEAFAQGIDIHAATASAMFGVPVGDVKGDRAAGQDHQFRHLRHLGLRPRRAPGMERGGLRVHQAVFRTLSGIRTYIDETKKFCREKDT